MKRDDFHHLWTHGMETPLEKKIKVQEEMVVVRVEIYIRKNSKNKHALLFSPLSHALTLSLRLAKAHGRGQSQWTGFTAGQTRETAESQEEERSYERSW